MKTHLRSVAKRKVSDFRLREEGRKRYPDWSPDGQKIAIAVHHGIDHIEVMDADGHNRVMLKNDDSGPS